jgi:hypothetical protein
VESDACRLGFLGGNSQSPPLRAHDINLNQLFSSVPTDLQFLASFADNNNFGKWVSARGIILVSADHKGASDES